MVDNPGNMILLGSVQRHELIKMIDKHIGREKRLEVAAKWQKEAQERARHEQEKLQKEIDERMKTRRTSRFEVIPAPDILKLREIANNEMLPAQAKKAKETLNSPMSGTLPKKSILKKTNSFNLKGFTPLSSNSPALTPYSTITGSESRIRSAFDVIFKKSATLQDVTPVDGDQGSLRLSNGDNISVSPSISKKVQLVRFFF